MSIEAVFLLGILIGNWIMLLAVWRATVKLLKVLATIEAQTNTVSTSENKIIYLPPKTGTGTE